MLHRATAARAPLVSPQPFQRRLSKRLGSQNVPRRPKPGASPMPKRNRCRAPDTEDTDSDDATTRPLPGQMTNMICGALTKQRVEFLHACGVPACILAVFLTLMARDPEEHTNRFLVEYFAGVASICFGFGCFQMQTAKYDKNYDEAMDLNTTIGMATALKFLCGLHKLGLVWAAPPCSSWVFLSVGTTCRSKSNPMGKTSNEKVHWNNILVHKLACLLEIATAFGCYFIVEQPTSSTLWQHPRVKTMFERLGCIVQDTHTYMGMYGGDSMKGMKLYGTAPFLHRPRPQTASACCLLQLPARACNQP